METIFYIVLNINTGKGFEPTAKFFVGNDRDSARLIFAQLKGQSNIPGSCMLQLDLVETINEIPINIQVMSCSLQELGENCQIITRETFKLMTLEEKL